MRVDRNYQREWLAYGRVVVLAAFMILFDLGGRERWLRSIFEVVFSPVEKVSSYVNDGMSDLGDRVRFMRSGAIRLVDAERKIAEYSATINRVGQLENENENLRKQLGILSGDLEYQTGEVVGIADDYVIMRFNDDPMFSGGSSVLWGDNLVGVVESVGSGLVKVMLLSGLTESVQVKIIDSSARDLGLGRVEGDASYGLVVDGVEEDIDTLENKLVVSYGVEGKLRSGYVIGEVVEVLSTDASLFGRGVVRPLYSPKVGDNLYVVIGERR